MKKTSFIIALVLSLVTSMAFARGIYQKPADFVAEVFAPQVPDVSVLWLTTDLQQQIQSILGRKLGLRLRYHLKDNRSVWILEEIGKEKPITAAFVVNNDKIERVKVLAFRESRGWEVKHGFFTDQFIALMLDKKNKLNQSVDNISGATLSVRAMKKMARLALFLHGHVTTKQ